MSTLATAQRSSLRLPRLDVIRPLWLRVVVGASGVALLASAFWVSPHAWIVWVALIAPDVPGLAGAGRDLSPKQMHPRAVRYYNLTHRLTGGALVGIAALATASPTLTAICLAWLAHVLIDRALGYTLRTSDGFLRQ